MHGACARAALRRRAVLRRVLYHLESWAEGLDQLGRLVALGEPLIVLETAIDRVTHTTPGKTAYGDTTTHFVPSLDVLDLLLCERGFDVPEFVNVGARRNPSPCSPSA